MDRIGVFFLKIFFLFVFFLVVTPVGLLLRAVGIDYLQRRFESKKNSYWIEKDKG